MSDSSPDVELSTGAATVVPALVARGLSAGFGPTPYVRDLELAVNPGEVLALVGANGAGKTTTVMALAGYLPAMTGCVEIDGAVATGGMDRRARGGIGLVTQDRCVFMGLTVRDNLRLGRGDPEEALQLFPELRDLLGRQTGLLSGGEQQMLAVARVLAAHPKILLADEMSIGLGPLIVERLLKTVWDVAERTGMAVVLVEQHLGRAFQFSHRMCVLQRGRVCLEGSRDEMRQQADQIASLYL
jgi:branched-chain amino acid transport system ATP-binding protein